MNNIFNALNKWVVVAIYVLLVVTMINGCNGCSSKKETNKLRKEVDSLTVEIQTLKESIYTKEQVDIRMSIEGYEISKRMLYDQNAIVRTVMRPDDRMNEYDLKIKELREKLSK